MERAVAQNEHVQRVKFSGISPSISNAFPPQWQLPVMGITMLPLNFEACRLA
jgi:hypothetical protein